jgi:GH3 auxin-responsive promoter
MVGEKLGECFISEALSSIGHVACLAPRAAKKPFYELLVEARRGDVMQSIAAVVDERLCANPQYAYARHIGQLGPVMVRAVDRLLDRYISAEMRRGRRMADIKPPTLIDDPGVYAALTIQVDSGISDYQLSLSSV